MPASSRSVVLTGGWAAHRHVGDDLALRAHLAALERALPEAEPVVLGAEPGVLAARFGCRAEREAEVVPAGGHDAASRREAARRLGSVLAAAEGRAAAPDPHSERLLEVLAGAEAVVAVAAGALASPHPDTLFRIATTLVAATALGVPVLVSGAGLGPLDRPLDEIAVGRALRGAELVSVRDSGSADLARRLGARAVVTGWDAAAGLVQALLEEPPALSDHAVLSAGPGVAELLAPAVARLHERHGLHTLAIPMDLAPGGSDAAALDELRSALPDPTALTVVDPLPSDEEIVRLVASARLALGTRFHLAVLAAVAGVPALLAHTGEYARLRAEGLRALAGGRVELLALGDDSHLVAAVDSLAAAQRAGLLQANGSLPAIERLA